MSACESISSISIPCGSIKRLSDIIRTLATKIFQFLVVRLKENPFKAKDDKQIFQFLVVRLKAKQVEFPDYTKIFQFLVVRLKVLPARCLLPVLRDFNSLWFD